MAAVGQLPSPCEHCGREFRKDLLQKCPKCGSAGSLTTISSIHDQPTLLSQETFSLRATYLGGVGTNFQPRDKGKLTVTNAGFEFESGSNSWSKPYQNLAGLQIGGVGAFKTGGGWVGGGSGVLGGLQGANQARILNSLTERTHVDCVLRVVYPGLDLSFALRITPRQLELKLSGVRNWLETRSTLAAPVVASVSVMDNLLAIEKLAELRDKGILTEEEFAAQKRKLLT